MRDTTRRPAAPSCRHCAALHDHCPPAAASSSPNERSATDQADTELAGVVPRLPPPPPPSPLAAAYHSAASEDARSPEAPPASSPPLPPPASRPAGAPPAASRACVLQSRHNHQPSEQSRHLWRKLARQHAHRAAGALPQTAKSIVCPPPRPLHATPTHAPVPFAHRTHMSSCASNSSSS